VPDFSNSCEFLSLGEKRRPFWPLTNLELFGTALDGNSQGQKSANRGLRFGKTSWPMHYHGRVRGSGPGSLKRLYKKVRLIGVTTKRPPPGDRGDKLCRVPGNPPPIGEAEEA